MQDRAEEERLRNLVKHGAAPPAPVSSSPDAPVVAGDDDTFTAADLTSELYRAEQHTMPNGKKVWVHPLAIASVCWLNAAAEAWAKRQAHIPGITDEERAARQKFAGFVFQVIACCRTGKAPSSPAVFRPEHADVIWTNLGETIQRICFLSDRLGGDEGLLEANLAAFFGATARWGTTWCSRLTTDSLESFRADLERFWSCVWRITQRRTLGVEDLAAMTALAEGADGGSSSG